VKEATSKCDKKIDLMIQQSTEANWGQMVVVSAVMSGDPEWNE
jgi:hypothetical protein